MIGGGSYCEPGGRGTGRPPMKMTVRQSWRGLVVLTLITALMGAVALAALAGARRTDTAVGRFVQYAGPMLGQVAADPAPMDKSAPPPDVAYTETGAVLRAL